MKIYWLIATLMLMNAACGHSRNGGQEKVSGVSGANTPVAPIREPAENEFARDNKMAIVAGIYTRRYQADSALARLRAFCRKAFVYEGMLFHHEIH